MYLKALKKQVQMTDRHAYCIIAHTDATCLQTLIDCIDDERNDIFIVIDRKTPPEFRSNFSTQHSGLLIIPEEKSIDVRWGHISQIKAELLGFEMVLANGNYTYIHLISGQDLPLKSQNYIHDFFSKLIPETNLVGLAQGEYNSKDLENKTRYYHFFTTHYRDKNIINRYFFFILRKMLLKTQSIFGVRRNWNDKKLYKGANWVSITQDFAKYIVSQKDWILKKFRYTPCADEIYKQTLLMNSHYKNTIFSPAKDFAGNTRLIDWERGKPYTWREEDFEELMSSHALFARKFSSTIDLRIIKRIREHITLNM